MRTRGVRRRAGAPCECENGGKSEPKSGKKRSQRAWKRMPAERWVEKTHRRAMSIFGSGSGSQLGGNLASKNEAKRCRNLKKNMIFVRFLKVCKKHVDLETILVRFSARAERQKRGKVMERLLEITFQPLQDNIEIGTVLGSILGGLGLHFREDLGSKTVPREVRKAYRKRDENEIDKKRRKIDQAAFGPPPPLPTPSRTLPQYSTVQ